MQQKKNNSRKIFEEEKPGPWIKNSVKVKYRKFPPPAPYAIPFHQAFSFAPTAVSVMTRASATASMALASVSTIRARASALAFRSASWACLRACSASWTSLLAFSAAACARRFSLSRRLSASSSARWRSWICCSNSVLVGLGSSSCTAVGGGEVCAALAWLER